MKRLIDLRGQGTGSRFAWYCTVRDRFEEHSGSQAWETWEQFVHDHEGDDLRRYRALCPQWVFEDPGPHAAGGLWVWVPRSHPVVVYSSAAACPFPSEFKPVKVRGK